MDVSLASPPPLPPIDLGAHLLATAVLDAAALLIAALICVALGVLMRFRPRAATAVIETISPLALAVPAFVLGPLLIFVFVDQLHLFPMGATNGQLFDLARLFLPALTLAIGAVALTLAQVRSRMFASARADGSWALIGLYLVGATISGTFVVETIFAWPGVGSDAFAYGIFFYGSSFLDLGTLWSIVLLTSAFYLAVALAAGEAARSLGQRGAVTRWEPDAPDAGGGAGRGDRPGLPRWAALALLGGGTALVAALVLATIVAPLLTRYDPTSINLSVTNGPPSAAHPLGTDDLGRDILSELLFAGRVSLAIGALAVVAAGVSGLALGALLGAVADGALTALMAFPTLFVALGLVDLLHPGFTSLVVAFAIVQIPTFARLGLTLVRARRRHNTTRSPGAQRRSTPEVIGLLLAQASSSMAIVLLGVSALTFFFGFFLGPDLQPPLFLGVHPPLFDWGALIGDGRGNPITSAWMLLAPALALGISVLGFTLVGQALRSLLEWRAIRSHQQGARPSRAVGERSVAPLWR